jgi:putative SOS response-associated peptidase YedK
MDEIELRQIIKVVEAKMREEYQGLSLKTEGEIFPGDTVPVQTGPDAFAPMRWDFTAYNGKAIINARSETAAEKPMFRESMFARRCLIPASGYFEWQKDGKQRIKYAFHLPDGPLYLAGCWRQERDAPLPVFVILTRDAVNGLEEIHDRMPVIIQKDRIGDWFTGGDVLGEAVTALDYAPADGDGQMEMGL